jgi:hypothetical protein
MTPDTPRHRPDVCTCHPTTEVEQTTDEERCEGCDGTKDEPRLDPESRGGQYLACTHPFHNPPEENTPAPTPEEKAVAESRATQEAMRGPAGTAPGGVGNVQSDIPIQPRKESDAPVFTGSYTPAPTQREGTGEAMPKGLRYSERKLYEASDESIRVILRRLAHARWSDGKTEERCSALEGEVERLREAAQEVINDVLDRRGALCVELDLTALMALEKLRALTPESEEQR